MKGIIGKKIGMTQLFDEESGRVTPVTVIQAGPCPVVQVKTVESDGYEAVQLAFDAVEQAAGEGLARVELLESAQFERIAPDLAGRVAVKLVATRNAAPSERTNEDRAMVMLAQAPVRGLDGKPLGLLRGGVLLNRNLAFIDHINEIVYPAGSLPFGSQGTATLFLDDVRISTNVRLFGGEQAERAIGTRVSRIVRDAVLGAGRTWLDRAFVVNDWYVSGYLPLADSGGQRVGMLYVGYLERPFAVLKYTMLAAIGAVYLGVMVLAAAVSLRWARSIFSPLEQMEATVRALPEATVEEPVPEATEEALLTAYREWRGPS